MNIAYNNTKLYSESIYTILCRESHSGYCSITKKNDLTIRQYTCTKLYTERIYTMLYRES